MEKSEKRKEKNTNASGISEYDSLVEMKRNESFFFDICKKKKKQQINTMQIPQRENFQMDMFYFRIYKRTWLLND